MKKRELKARVSDFEYEKFKDTRMRINQTKKARREDERSNSELVRETIRIGLDAIKARLDKGKY